MTPADGTGAGRPPILVVGEALVDVVREGDAVRESPGGSPANVAVALGRLGHRPALLTALADDARGRAVTGWLGGAGVAVRASVPSTGRTSVAEATIGPDGGAEYVFDIAWDLAGPETAVEPAPAVVHTGSIATVLDPGARAVEGLLRAHRGHALVSFDPNARPAITPDRATTAARVEAMLPLAHIVKASAEDLAWYHPGVPPLESARRWAAVRGGRVVVLTLGDEGAVVLRDADEIAVPARRVRVVDTIAAGDTFAAAFLDALVRRGVHGPAAGEALHGLAAAELAEAARWAVAAAAITVSRQGADPPTRDEVTASLA